MAVSAGDAQLFEGVFKVTEVNQQKYDRVARIWARSDASSDLMDMTLDINIELFPMLEGDVFRAVLATSLSLDGSKDDDKAGWRDATKLGGPATLADSFDYVCHGKIYKFEDSEDGDNIKAYISFGGLLMCLNGPYKKLTPLRVDYVYLLIKGNKD